MQFSFLLVCMVIRCDTCLDAWQRKSHMSRLSLAVKGVGYSHTKLGAGHLVKQPSLSGYYFSHPITFQQCMAADVLPAFHYAFWIVRGGGDGVNDGATCYCFRLRRITRKSHGARNHQTELLTSCPALSLSLFRHLHILIDQFSCKRREGAS